MAQDHKLSPPAAPGRAPAHSSWLRVPGRFARRRPFVAFFLLVFVLSNGAGSVFSILYNDALIVRHYLDAGQTAAFWHVVVPVYNVVAYPVCLAVMAYLLWPLWTCHRRLRTGQPVTPGQMENCRRLLVNLPFYQVCINFFGWIPGAVLFPLGICLLAGWHEAGAVWLQFALSFTVSALLTTVQTFFLMEAFLITVFYPEFFRDARPAEVQGTLRIPFRLRLLLFWVAVAVVPLLALLVVTLNIAERPRESASGLQELVWGVALISAGSGGLISWMVGRNLLSWVEAHAAATEEIALENYDVRVRAQRPDELGRLTDHFNDMAAALARARLIRETFGQVVHPEVRDLILDQRALGGEVVEITVLFLDIRGFTRRAAGQAPERTVALLNRFFTLAVAAVEEKGGLVNKFLGDGLLALFGAPRPRRDHADLAVEAARELLRRLDRLNRELEKEGQAPLAVGVGIHTGPALVGSVGATLTVGAGRPMVRRELTAIGQTVNLGQRLEQLTKTCPGPVLLSEQTRRRLERPFPLTCLGPQAIPGLEERVVVYRLEAEVPART
jgi:adenylate cyclase